MIHMKRGSNSANLSANPMILPRSERRQNSAKRKPTANANSMSWSAYKEKTLPQEERKNDINNLTQVHHTTEKEKCQMENIHTIPIWELAFHISVKLNRILRRMECYRDGAIVPYPEIEPEQILKRANGREELEFYYKKLAGGNEHEQ